VIRSSLGIILTGFVLAVEGFSSSGISYDLNGWFNYWAKAVDSLKMIDFVFIAISVKTGIQGCYRKTSLQTERCLDSGSSLEWQSVGTAICSFSELIIVST
jgi:hypothetical protein